MDEVLQNNNPETPAPTPTPETSSGATSEELKQMYADLTAQLADLKKEMQAKHLQPEDKHADWNTFREEVINRYGTKKNM